MMFAVLLIVPCSPLDHRRNLSLRRAAGARRARCGRQTLPPGGGSAKVGGSSSSGSGSGSGEGSGSGGGGAVDGGGGGSSQGAPPLVYEPGQPATASTQPPKVDAQQRSA